MALNQCCVLGRLWNLLLLPHNPWVVGLPTHRCQEAWLSTISSEAAWGGSINKQKFCSTLGKESNCWQEWGQEFDLHHLSKRLSMVAHACHSSTVAMETGRSWVSLSCLLGKPHTSDAFFIRNKGGQFLKNNTWFWPLVSLCTDQCLHPTLPQTKA